MIQLYDEDYPVTLILDIDRQGAEEVIEFLEGIEYTYEDLDKKEDLYSITIFEFINTYYFQKSLADGLNKIEELCNKHNTAYFRFIS